MKKYKNVILIGAGTLLLIVIFIVSLVAVKNKMDADKKESASASSEEKTKEVKESSKTRLVKKGMSTVFSSAAGKDIDVSEYIDENFADEDAEFVNEMLDDKVDAELIIDLAKGYVAEGDISGKSVKSLLKKLTPEERERLEEIYYTYGDDFLNYIGGN